MTKHIASRDIYDKNQILLLKKGQRITREVKLNLKKHWGLDMKEISNPKDKRKLNNKSENVLEVADQAYKIRMKIRYFHTLEQASKILNTIIFEMKHEPWWIHVNALGNYVDWIYTHSINVGLISLMLSIELGYSGDDLFDIGLGSFLHDIGKILIPKSILEKTEPLTETEMRLVRQHCELGLSSLESYNLSEICKDIIMQHHEKLNKSGYPRGLKGEDISHFAKIVMVANALDLITTDGSHNKIKDINTAINILKENGDKYPQNIVFLLENMMR